MQIVHNLCISGDDGGTRDKRAKNDFPPNVGRVATLVGTRHQSVPVVVSDGDRLSSPSVGLNMSDSCSPV